MYMRSFYFEFRTCRFTSFNRSHDSCFNLKCKHRYFSIVDCSCLFWFGCLSHVGQIERVELLVQHTKIFCISVWFASPVWNVVDTLCRQRFNEKGIIYLSTIFYYHLSICHQVKKLFALYFTSSVINTLIEWGL